MQLFMNFQVVQGLSTRTCELMFVLCDVLYNTTCIALAIIAVKLAVYRTACSSIDFGTGRRESEGQVGCGVAKKNHRGRVGCSTSLLAPLCLN